MHADATESARVDTGITPDLLDLIRRAAEIQGCSVSDYLAATLALSKASATAEFEESSLV